MKKITIDNKIEIVKVSSKGQVVLPKSLREKLDLRKDSFVALTNINGAVILKKIQGMTKEDYETMLGVAKAWKDIEEGRYKKWDSKKEFLEYLKRL